MKIHNDTKIIICSPRNYYSGGPESIHQLGSCLKRMNFKVEMLYIGENGGEPVHDRLKKYHLPIAMSDEDPNSVLIVPETTTLRRDRKSPVIYWWLSIDNHFHTICDRLNDYIKQRNFIKASSPVVDVLNEKDIEHFVQSEYARQFLEFNQISSDRIHFVGDYLVPTFLEKAKSISLDSKEDQIVYNPKKGFDLTKKLIDAAPDLKFIPIQNMNSDQVQDLLAKSKIYIDFGNHPGKDRIPREAAASHCVVVTGKRGSAGNEIDIPIPPDFKFDDSIGNDEKIIPQIIERLRSILKNFNEEHDRQNSYRDLIHAEPKKLFMDVARAFNFDPNKKLPTKIAIVGNKNEIVDIINAIWRDPNLDIVFIVNDELAGQLVQFSNREIEVITESDALFLFDEKRIDQFLSP